MNAKEKDLGKKIILFWHKYSPNTKLKKENKNKMGKYSKIKEEKESYES